MRLRDVVLLLERLAPPALAESWDNVGLLTGDLDAPVERALFTVDYTAEVAHEAEESGVQLVVAYHPPIFQALKRLPSTSLVFQAIRKGIALYSPHTALDLAEQGTNDVLADVVGLRTRAPLRPRKGDASGPLLGLGRVGSLPAPTPRAEILRRIKAGLGVEQVLLAGPDEGNVSEVAVGAGACGDLYRDAIDAGVELYLTGEMRHHDALACAEAGMTVVSVLHSNSERVALRKYAERFAARAAGCIVVVSRSDRDPFTIG